MATPLGITPRLVFGVRAPPGAGGGDCLQYGEDGSYVYPAGHTVVLSAPDSKAQRFLPGTPECECVTALAVSPNKRLLAVAERAEKGIISIYDLQTLKRRKVLQASEVGPQEYVSVSFSPDGKQLLAQGGGPEWNLLLFSWERAKVTACVRTTNVQGAPLCKCSLSPGDGSLATAVGPGVLRIFRVAEGGLKALPLNNAKRESLPFTCQAWLPPIAGSSGAGEGGDKGGGGAGGGEGGRDKERQLLGTSDGEILLLEGTELRATFSCDSAGKSVESLVTYGKGFAAGQEGGLVTLFERDEREKEGFRRARTFSVHDHPLKVKCLAVSPNEEQLALMLEGGPAFTLALLNQELMKPGDMNFEALGPGLHTEGVTGMDTCVRRPLVVTCSTDRHVRLWNYLDRTCELDRSFTEEAHSVAIHPTGTMILVGFSDKLRLMGVLMDDLKTIKELAIRSCRDVAFAHGGHLFAAVNGISVGIYNSYTAENIGNLRGHNGKVRSLCWSPDDTRLLSSGADGAVYEWKLSDLKRHKESVLKGCSYNAAVATPDNRALLAAGSDKKIKELEESAGSGTQVSKEVDTDCAVTALALPYGGRVLFAGTETGAVRGYRYPLTGEFYEVKLHAGPVTRLAVSYDDCLLVSAGADGAVAVMDVRDKELAKASTRRDQEKLPWAEEVLVSKADLDERRARVTELEQQVAELTMQTEYQLRLKDLHMQERLKEVMDKNGTKQDADRQTFEMLLAEKNEQEMEYEEKLKGAEARAAAQLAALDGQYQAKLMTEVERYSSLLQEKEALNERWDEQNALLVESHERVIAELTEEYEASDLAAKLAEEALAKEALRQEKEALEREFGEVKHQMEEDADCEIEDLKEKYEQRLGYERETALRLKGENGIMRKKFQGLAKDLEEQREALTAQHEQQKDLYATIKGLEKDIAGLKREIRERDDTIGDKERRIYELKKKNQELEKFKFVLDFKIKELKKQIEPREVEIGKMRQIVSAMDSELERYHKSNAGLDLAIQSLKLKESGLQSEVLQQRSTKSEVAARYDKVLRDIASLSPVIQDPKALKEQAKSLFHRYCSGMPPADAPDDAVASEHARQRQYLERTVDSLKKKLAADAEAHRLDGLHVMSQNVALIREINELRREIKALKSPGVTQRGSAKGSLASLTASYVAPGAKQRPVGAPAGQPPRTAGAAASSSLGSSIGAARGAGAQGPGAAPPSASSSGAGPARAAAPASAGGRDQRTGSGSGGGAPVDAEAAGMRRELEMQAALIERLRAELEARDGALRSLADSGAGDAAKGAAEPLGGEPPGSARVVAAEGGAGVDGGAEGGGGAGAGMDGRVYDAASPAPQEGWGDDGAAGGEAAAGAAEEGGLPVPLAAAVASES